jgi:leucyl/phenylalanyl-tRNA--protein transferase
VIAVSIEPPPSRWELPSAAMTGEGEIAGVGGDLAPGTLLAAYRQGLFPMRVRPRGPIGWWSPDPRGVIPLDGLHVSRSLRRSCRSFDLRVDTAFESVVRGCADPRRPHGWIDKKFVAAYVELHRLGWAHSVETWSVDESGDGELVGGLYGVSIGGLFAAESKFHRARDASKVAVVGLVDLMREGGAALLDVQWATPHLESLGAIAIPRDDYLERLSAAVTESLPSTFAAASSR